MNDTLRLHRPHLLTGLVFSLLLLTAMQGCMNALVREYNPQQEPLWKADVHQIGSIALDDYSHIPPLPIEEAVGKSIQDTLQQAPHEKTVPLSLEEVRAAALENNLELKVQLVNPSLARETYNVERAKFEAYLSGGIRQANTDTPTASQLVGSQSSLTQFELGVTQPLPTGGEFRISLPGGRFETDNQFALLNPSFESDLQFSISQPLLRGAGFQANTHSIRVMGYQSRITDAQTKLEAIRLLALADKAYWLVYGASRELEVRQEQYRLAQRQLNEARLRVKAQAAPQVEITRAESGLAARLEGIISGTTRLRLRERDLKRIINRPDLPIDSDTAVLPTTPPQPVGLRLDTKSLADFAAQNRMEMLEEELQLAIDESTIDFEKNAALPLFVLDYEYNLNGLGGSFGQSLDQMSGARFADWSVGLRAQIPLGNQAAKARVRHAWLARVQRLATKEQREQAIRQEVLNAADMLEENWQRILAARQEVVFAARTYEAERKQFELGARTSTDVLDAAAGLALAQSREIQALIDYQHSQVDIAYATGTLLGHAQVEWKPVELEASNRAPF
ncbi:MAG: TolC family protein [bacterium]